MLGIIPPAWSWTTTNPGFGKKVTAALTPLRASRQHQHRLHRLYPKNHDIIATGAHDGRISAFDLAKKALLKDIVAHADKESSPSDFYYRFFAGRQPDSLVELRSFAKAAQCRQRPPRARFQGPDDKISRRGIDEVYATAFSPDGTLIASGSGGLECGVKIWKTDDGSVVRDLVDSSLPALQRRRPRAPGLDLSRSVFEERPARQRRRCARIHGHIAVWNVADGKLFHAEATAFGSIYGFALSRG